MSITRSLGAIGVVSAAVPLAAGPAAVHKSKDTLMTSVVFDSQFSGPVTPNPMIGTGPFVSA